MVKENPCIICEQYIKGMMCYQFNCPVALMKKENRELKEKVQRLEREKAWRPLGEYSPEMGGN